MKGGEDMKKNSSFLGVLFALMVLVAFSTNVFGLEAMCMYSCGNLAECYWDETEQQNGNCVGDGELSMCSVFTPWGDPCNMSQSWWCCENDEYCEWIIIE